MPQSSAPHGSYPLPLGPSTQPPPPACPSHTPRGIFPHSELTLTFPCSQPPMAPQGPQERVLAPQPSLTQPSTTVFLHFLPQPNGSSAVSLNSRCSSNLYTLHILFPLLKMSFPSSVSSKLSQYTAPEHDFGAQGASINSKSILPGCMTLGKLFPLSDSQLSPS